MVLSFGCRETMEQPAAGITKYLGQPTVTDGLRGRLSNAGAEAMEKFTIQLPQEKHYHVWRAEARIRFAVEPYALC
jgi:hypothetical protein